MQNAECRIRSGAILHSAFRILHSIAVPLILLILWESLSRAYIINPLILPAPSRVLLKWLDYAKSGELPRDAVSSLYRVVMGFLIGTALAYARRLAPIARPSGSASAVPMRKPMTTR